MPAATKRGRKRTRTSPSPEVLARAHGLKMVVEEVDIREAVKVAQKMLKPFDGKPQALIVMATLTAFYLAMLTPEMIDQLVKENDGGERLGRFLDAASPQVASLFHLAITPREKMGAVN